MTAKPGFGFLGVQASGLLMGSFPVEVAWVLADGHHNAFFVRPAPNWDLDLWDPVAEAMHGISLEDLAARGQSAVDLAVQMNFEIGDIPVFVSSLDYERAWIDMLFEAAGEQRRFRIVSITRAFERLGIEPEQAQWAFDQARASRQNAGQALGSAIYLMKVLELARSEGSSE